MNDSPGWIADVKSSMASSIDAIDDFVDARWRHLRKRWGNPGVPSIQAYHGFANDRFAWFHGRVLTNPPNELPSETDSWWDNLRNTYERIESDEVPGVEIEIEFGDNVYRTFTDEEGYYHIETPHLPDVEHPTACRTATVRIVNSERISRDDSVRFCKVFTPPASAKFGIISDIDDTVMHTGVTGLLTVLKLTFLHNARTRKPLEGVSALYRAMQVGSGPDCPHNNPIFYVSSSPWNLYDLLEDFFELGGIPSGPILLRDLGFDENKLLAQGHGHKRDKACRILDAYPDLPFVLFGDSGQEDAALYAEVAEKYPRRIRAIFIRDVDPDQTSYRDEAVAEAIKLTAALGIPMHLVSDSNEVAQVALAMGMIEPSAIEKIASKTAMDAAFKA